MSRKSHGVDLRAAADLPPPESLSRQRSRPSRHGFESQAPLPTNALRGARRWLPAYPEIAVHQIAKTLSRGVASCNPPSDRVRVADGAASLLPVLRRFLEPGPRNP